MEEETTYASNLESGLKDVGDSGMFAVNRSRLVERVRRGEFSWDDVYVAHKEFAEREKWGVGDLAKRLTNVHPDWLKDIPAIRTQILRHGLDSLSGEDRWYLKYAENRGLIKTEEAETRYRESMAMRAYGLVQSEGRAGLETPEHLDYGLEHKLFLKSEVDEMNDAYKLKSVRRAITEYGLSGLPDEHREMVEYCTEKGLLSQGDIRGIEQRRKIVTLII